MHVHGGVDGESVLGLLAAIHHFLRLVHHVSMFDCLRFGRVLNYRVVERIVVESYVAHTAIICNHTSVVKCGDVSVVKSPFVINC